MNNILKEKLSGLFYSSCDRGLRYGIIHLPLFKIILVIILLLIFSILGGCSIEGLKSFEIESVNLDSDAVIGTNKSSIEVLFNKKIDEQKAYGKVRVEEEGGDQVSIDINISDKRLIVTPIERWQPHRRYWLVVDKDIEDIYGKKMERNYHLSFRSTKELLPVSALIVDPVIENNKVNGDIEYLEIAFSGEVNRASVERAFSIAPVVEGRFSWFSGDNFLYIFNKPLSKNSTYTVTITDEGLDFENFPLKSFSKTFEYCPNTQYPEINLIMIDGITVFDRNEPDTYLIEDDCYLIQAGSIEKDAVFRVVFSTDVDKSSFESGFEITPTADWSILWIDNRTVDVSFSQNLKLEEFYRLKFGKNIKGVDGLLFQHSYQLEVEINAQFSRFLNFYAGDFTDLAIDADLDSEGTTINNTGISIGEDSDGYFVKINYNDTALPEEIDVSLLFTLRFLNDSYSPVIRKNTLQDSVNFSFVLGTNSATSSKTGNIDGYNWQTDNECVLHVGELATDNIYRLNLLGGENGVEDIYDNYLEDDVDYYFRLILEQD